MSAGEGSMGHTGGTYLVEHDDEHAPHVGQPGPQRVHEQRDEIARLQRGEQPQAGQRHALARRLAHERGHLRGAVRGPQRGRSVPDRGPGRARSGRVH